MRTITIPKSDVSPWTKPEPVGTAPCVVCGRPVNVRKAHHEIHCIEGGLYTALHPDDDDEYTDHAADMGCYPVGADCLRRFAELKPFAIRFEAQ